MRILKVYLTILSASISLSCFSQCPPNIGFEDGSFSHWECSAGTVEGATGAITLSNSGAAKERHTLFKNEGKIERDYFGDFPVYSSNGSLYSVRLGNSQIGAEAERIGYTFNIPADAGDFTIIYNYAVVLQNPDHMDFEQPKFTSRVFNVTDNQYIDCASFEYIAGPNLPGFLSSPKDPSIFYKKWSPVTIKLTGYAGKTVRLEFTTNDCARGGHFGYAYIDVMENCSTPISGSIICNGIASMRLVAPSGFAGYKWFNSDFSQMLGSANILDLNPVPPVGAVYHVAIEPFSNQGCRDTLETTITSAPAPLVFNLLPSIDNCIDKGVDLTIPAVTAGSTPNLKLSYFVDAYENSTIDFPQKVTTDGTYYIKAVNSLGCSVTEPIDVIIHRLPDFTVNAPPAVAYPETIDLTSLPVSSDADLTYTYWTDAATTKAVVNPSATNDAGTYYIKATTQHGCTVSKPVTLIVDPLMCAPNAFSPNHDGINDIFRYVMRGRVRTLHYFRIYNRWGQLVFSTTNKEEGWDGTSKGHPQPAGTYSWMLHATDFAGKQYTGKGLVMLLR